MKEFDFKNYFNKTILRLTILKIVFFIVVFILVFNINPLKTINFVDCPVDARGGYCFNPFYDSFLKVDPVNNLPELIPAGFSLNNDKIILKNLMTNGCLFIFLLGLLVNHIFWMVKRRVLV